MDNFNKIVSFVLGLVVVIVFLAVITGRFNIRKSFQGFGGQTKGTSTPTPTPTPVTGQNLSVTPAPVAKSQTITVNKRTNTKTPTSIPATGSPTLLLSSFFSALSLGIYLKRKK